MAEFSQPLFYATSISTPHKNVIYMKFSTETRESRRDLMQKEKEKMQRRGRKVWKNRAGMRTKSGFRCRIHVSRPRLRIFYLLEKMKQPFHCFWASLALAGKNTFKSFVGATANRPASVYAPVAASSNSFYTEAIADCIDFIKRSSSPMDSRPDRVS